MRPNLLINEKPNLPQWTYKHSKSSKSPFSTKYKKRKHQYVSLTKYQTLLQCFFKVNVRKNSP